jgi:hypothetical protein
VNENSFGSLIHPFFVAHLMTSEPSEKQTAEESLIKLVQQLSHVITYSESSNFDTNKKLWNNYAKVKIGLN